jgi:hypothetical protein
LTHERSILGREGETATALTQEELAYLGQILGVHDGSEK